MAGVQVPTEVLASAVAKVVPEPSVGLTEEALEAAAELVTAVEAVAEPIAASIAEVSPQVNDISPNGVMPPPLVDAPAPSNADDRSAKDPQSSHAPPAGAETTVSPDLSSKADGTPSKESTSASADEAPPPPPPRPDPQ